MKNQQIKLLARGNGIALWEIAKTLGISEATLTRRLRVTLSREQDEEIVKAIEQLKAEKTASN
jgi:DNA-binding Lrp family transcriptional regulator